MDLPLVSISVANYNNGKYIVETLDSIYNQTYANIELIIVDDCSTDNSVEIINAWINKYGKRFQHTKLICHERNQGVCVVANTMIKNSNGNYFSIIASDDSMLPEKTSTQVAIFQNCSPEVGMLYSDAYLMQEDGSPRYGWFIQDQKQGFIWPPSGWIFKELLRANFIPAMSIMLKKEVLDKVGYFDESLVYEDYDMWLRIASNYQIVYCDIPFVKYRISSGSLSQTIKKWNPSKIRILAKHQDKEGVIERLTGIAREAYLGKDVESLNLLYKLCNKSPEIMKIIRYYRLKPIYTVRRIFYKTLRHWA